jgi:4-hydroxybenzoate polyprenyltransferase/phosphoserine phosphatase
MAHPDHPVREALGDLEASAAGPAPLVVDLDGTLTRTDTLFETFVQVVRRDPRATPRVLLALAHGRAAFKSQIAARASFSPGELPYHAGLLDYLVVERSRGRRIFLATAAHRSIAEAVAAHLGIFDGVLGTSGDENLKGQAKLVAIRRAVGPRFVYAADSAADLPVWRGAAGAILVGASPALAARVRGSVPIEHEFPPQKVPLRTWLRALRVHQWLKNVLLFVPLLTAFSFFEAGKVLALLAGFASFSLAASATYIINDLWDLENDRAHPRKRHRPFASGAIPIRSGLAVAAGALVAALAVAAAVSPAFLLMVLAYLALTNLYSWILKRKVIIDVLALSILYTLRILAGAAAAGIEVSSWLLAFSVFVFFSLAMVKRCGELVSLQQAGVASASGRDYNVSDMIVLWPLGVGSALCAVVVFGLFIMDPETLERYASPRLLWLVAVALIYWLSRLWIKAARGEMDDDPLVYALRNRNSRFTVLAMIAAMLAARFVEVF